MVLLLQLWWNMRNPWRIHAENKNGDSLNALSVGTTEHLVLSTMKEDPSLTFNVT